MHAARWTGDSSTQAADLQKDVDILQQESACLRLDRDNARNEVSDLKTDLSSLHFELVALRQDRDNAQNEVNNMPVLSVCRLLSQFPAPSDPSIVLFVFKDSL